MTTDLLDDVEIDRGGVPRDRYKRALLVPPGGGPREPYASMSTLAGQLGYLKALHEWELAAVAQGVGMSRELAAIAGSSRWNTWAGEEDEGRNREERRILDDVVFRAKEKAGAHRKADWGTGFHRYAEQKPEDILGEPPEEMAVDLEAFRKTLRLLGIEILDTELFVVNERVRGAGQFDYLLYVPWREKLVIGDSKTGRLKLDQDEIQLAGYAGSEIYDRDTNQRTTFAEAFGMEVDQEYALTIRTAAESRTTDLHPVDIAAGATSLELAAAVHKRNSEVRKRYNKAARQPLDVAAIAQERAQKELAAIAQERAQKELSRVEGAAEYGMTFEAVRAELKRVHNQFKTVWTDELTQRGGAILRAQKEAA